MYYYGNYGSGSCGCNQGSYGYSYPNYGGYGNNGGYGASIVLVLFILLVIIIGCRTCNN